MRIKLLAAAMSLLCLCSCSANYDNNNNRDSVSDNTVKKGESTLNSGVEIEPVIIGKNNEENLSSLSHEKNGYGQGVQLDNQNRPQGAIDFNAKYGKYNAKAINDEKGTITLTFDQGYENGYTAKILDTLKEKNVKATFFVLQDYAEKNPELVQRMIDEGHIVGNHSVTHRSMPELTEEECTKEIKDLHDYIKENFNYEMTMFRPPMGEFSEFSLAVTKKCGYETELWSYAYADWDVNAQPSEEEAYGKLTGALHDGAIYLLHSVSPVNAEILPDFIDAAIEAGYKFK